MELNRVVSGISMALVIALSVLFLSNRTLSILIGIIVCLSAWEFFKLRFSTEISILLSILLFISLVYFSFGVSFQLTISSLGFLLWIILGVLILGFPHNKNFVQNIFFQFFSGFLIHFSFYFSLMLIINSSELLLEPLNIQLSSRAVLLLLITLTALTDMLAYFGGKKFGKRKFLPNISPNKTFEGFIIGILGTCLLVMPIMGIFYKYVFLKLLFIILVVSLFSVIGDATASLFKRISGVKDSSNLIPGHGGVLDRIDSHLASAPAFVLMIYIFKGI